MADRAKEALQSGDIPQANKLELVRLLLEEIRAGRSTKGELGDTSGLSPRHVAYYLQAARTLGCLADAGVTARVR